jgi:hypothetical protein
MTSKEAAYKLSLVGGDITVKDRQISEDVARKIIVIIMGGDVTVAVHEHGGHDSSRVATLGGALTPKQFMTQKRPSSELERITCLAYYLTHNRSTPAFKTRDITKLNTEAAQPAFSNAAVFARNAVQSEWLSKAGGGSKQITALGEAVVEALPDRDKVKAAIESNRSSRLRRGRRKRVKTS